MAQRQSLADRKFWARFPVPGKGRFGGTGLSSQLLRRLRQGATEPEPLVDYRLSSKLS